MFGKFALEEAMALSHSRHWFAYY